MVWLAAPERLTLSLDTLRVGAWVETIESYPGSPESIVYAARCIAHDHGNGLRSVSLLYDEVVNTRIAEAFDIRWGTRSPR